MNADELYDEIALYFPAVWPSLPHQRWVNVHDGNAPVIEAIESLLRQHLDSDSVVVLRNRAASMALTKKREFWYGTTSGDTQTELRSYSIANRYEAARFASSKCDCGCQTFAL